MHTNSISQTLYIERKKNDPRYLTIYNINGTFLVCIYNKGIVVLVLLNYALDCPFRRTWIKIKTVITHGNGFHFSFFESIIFTSKHPLNLTVHVLYFRKVIVSFLGGKCMPIRLLFLIQRRDYWMNHLLFVFVLVNLRSTFSIPRM